VEEKPKKLSIQIISLSTPVPIAAKNTATNAPMMITAQAAAHHPIQITIKFIHNIL
jgi:hypothetical protein